MLQKNALFPEAKVKWVDHVVKSSVLQSNATNLPPQVKKWLGGNQQQQTLGSTTTNKRGKNPVAVITLE